jgi:copper resistance protein B
MRKGNRMTVKKTACASALLLGTTLALGVASFASADMKDDAIMTKFILDRFETRSQDGDDLLNWEAQINARTDYQGMAFKTSGERPHSGPTESAEYQLLYQRLVSEFFDAQFGIRYDNQPGPSRTYAVAGLQGLAPYWFEVDANLFLSKEGDASARIEAEYDLLLTQRLVLQPSAEITVAFSDDEEIGLGSGLSSAEVGLRLRYEVSRKFVPYVGINWEKSFGNTADFAREEGEDTEAGSLVIGVSAWF